jgi:hypothetical protein
MRTMHVGAVAFAMIWLLAGVKSIAQSVAVETMRDAYALLSPDEKQSFDAAGKAFGAGKHAEALTAYKALLAAHVGDEFLSKMAAESAIETGDLKLALALIQPIAARNPDDWQAAGLLTHAYAQMGDKEHRDAGMAHMDELYKRGLTPKGLDQYLLEKMPAGDRQVAVWHSFRPWGNFQVYDFARVFNSQGQLVYRIELESPDFDQSVWAKQNPEKAAAGGRMFTVDGYLIGPTNAAGQHTETHTTYALLDGRPTYDEVRTRFIAIAENKASALSKTVKTVQEVPRQP